MIPLRVKLNIPETDPPPGAKDAFDAISEIHSDQAIFQVNQTQYVDERSWGFRVTYRENRGFVQSTRVQEIEQLMSQVASNSFERRVETESTATDPE
jgi:maltodextrin utilization protein YvdJ